MPLHSVPRPDPVGPIPTNIRAFSREADRRIRGYYRRHRNSAFVPCNFRGAYGILQHLAAQAEAAGTLFCEWGSGFGMVTCLAALLEFDAGGIEVDSTLARLVVSPPTMICRSNSRKAASFLRATGY